jgi:hypothetical protein
MNDCQLSKRKFAAVTFLLLVMDIFYSHAADHTDWHYRSAACTTIYSLKRGEFRNVVPRWIDTSLVEKSWRSPRIPHFQPPHSLAPEPALVSGQKPFNEEVK